MIIAQSASRCLGPLAPNWALRLWSPALKPVGLRSDSRGRWQALPAVPNQEPGIQDTFTTGNSQRIPVIDVLAVPDPSVPNSQDNESRTIGMGLHWVRISRGPSEPKVRKMLVLQCDMAIEKDRHEARGFHKEERAPYLLPS